MQHYRSTICKQSRTMYVYLVGNRFSITVKSLQAELEGPYTMYVYEYNVRQKHIKIPSICTTI